MPVRGLTGEWNATQQEIRDMSDSSLTCSICLEDFVGADDASGDLVGTLPLCGHRFHLKCIEKWAAFNCLKQCFHFNCPICRRNIGSPSAAL